jgi:hypothetical protein
MLKRIEKGRSLGLDLILCVSISQLHWPRNISSFIFRWALVINWWCERVIADPPCANDREFEIYGELSFVLVLLDWVGIVGHKVDSRGRSLKHIFY